MNDIKRIDEFLVTASAKLNNAHDDALIGYYMEEDHIKKDKYAKVKKTIIELKMMLDELKDIEV